MRTPEEWIHIWAEHIIKKGTSFKPNEIINDIQTEAYNQAIDDAIDCLEGWENMSLYCQELRYLKK